MFSLKEENLALSILYFNESTTFFDDYEINKKEEKDCKNNASIKPKCPTSTPQIEMRIIYYLVTQILWDGGGNAGNHKTLGGMKYKKCV